MKLQAVLIIIIVLIIALISAEEDLNQLYCQMNDFARERVLSGLKVFPCSQQ